MHRQNMVMYHRLLLIRVAPMLHGTSNCFPKRPIRSRCSASAVATGPLIRVVRDDRGELMLRDSRMSVDDDANVSVVGGRCRSLRLPPGAARGHGHGRLPGVPARSLAVASAARWRCSLSGRWRLAGVSGDADDEGVLRGCQLSRSPARVTLRALSWRASEIGTLVDGPSARCLTTAMCC